MVSEEFDVLILIGFNKPFQVCRRCDDVDVQQSVNHGADSWGRPPFSNCLIMSWRMHKRFITLVFPPKVQLMRRVPSWSKSFHQEVYLLKSLLLILENWEGGDWSCRRNKFQKQLGRWNSRRSPVSQLLTARVRSNWKFRWMLSQGLIVFGL